MVSDSTSETVAQRIDALLRRIGDDLQSHHVVFREELKKTAPMADLVDVTLWAEEGNGKVSCEIITVPGQIFEPGTDRYAKLLEYIAVCLNIKGGDAWNTADRDRDQPRAEYRSAHKRRERVL